MLKEIRKIIHVDMDAFYASVEQRENPELRGKAIAVGGSEKRGVVMTASYEARKFGVRSAMPSKMAFERCPNIIFVKPHFETYGKVSKQIREIFKSYTNLVEPLSLDEAYLDVTENKFGNPSATLIAKEIKQRIKDELQLTASAGVSISKFLAKVASDMQKPDGLTVIPPDKAEAFIETLKIEKIPGIGKVTAEKMNKLGIKTGADIKKMELNELIKRFGKTGSYYYHLVRCENISPVVPDRIRKSLAAENTFNDDIEDENEMIEELEKIMEILERRILKTKTSGKTITLKIKYHDFQTTTRSKTLKSFTDSKNEIFEIVKELLSTPEKPFKPVRLLGVSLSNLNHENVNLKTDQLDLKF
ncbi:MAG TPA: DNA polymerase IV [Ignavibacteriaceae bacterium]|nr:DNA polymerase IV [Ignavibacteriaceae bacterium]